MKHKKQRHDLEFTKQGLPVSHVNRVWRAELCFDVFLQDEKLVQGLALKHPKNVCSHLFVDAYSSRQRQRERESVCVCAYVCMCVCVCVQSTTRSHAAHQVLAKHQHVVSLAPRARVQTPALHPRTEAADARQAAQHTAHAHAGIRRRKQASVEERAQILCIHKHTHTHRTTDKVPPPPPPPLIPRRTCRRRRQRR